MPNYLQPSSKRNKRRQSLLRPLLPAPTGMKLEGPEKPSVRNQIETRADLQAALASAFALELATIPPYMCGLYSIRDGTNVEAASLIRSVLVEEMLHMVLVANLLNAISEPDDVAKLLRVEELMASYPTALPGNIRPAEPKGFEVQLLPFSPKAIDEFLVIEHPSDPYAAMPGAGKYLSIGQFYQAIRFGFDHLKNVEGGLFIGDPERQITEEQYYGSGGRIVLVDDIESAEKAILEIVGQGEGIDGTIQDPDSSLFGQEIEFAHYFKFQEIRFGRFYRASDTNQQAPTKSIPSGEAFDVSYGTAHAMMANPKVADYRHDPALERLAVEFNRLYTDLITAIVASATGDRTALSRAVPVMHALRERAKSLMNIELPDGSFAGPTFEYTPSR
ncbi:MAG: ferritin-like protein [Sandaracinaceae bacterium]|nr:ferritin-like protein [Sandaracinaceae bacterium]